MNVLVEMCNDRENQFE